jgi:hypothetical protein
MEPKIEKGRALVLAGPQGCGKTTLARKLASAAGSYVEMDARDLEEDGFALGAHLAQRPKTCIVDGFPRGEVSLTRLKAMITSDEVACHRKGLNPVLVPAPNFIFCSDDSQPLKHLEGVRRFRIVRLGAITGQRK